MMTSKDNIQINYVAQPRLRSFRYIYDLLSVMVGRDMKLRYKRSLLGLGWSLLNPLAELLTLGYVFGRLLNVSTPHYIVFLFTGLLAWNWFSGGLSSSTNVIVGNSSLVKLPGFPVALLPIATITTFFVHFLIALPILLIFILLDGLSITPAIMMSPIVMGIQFIFTLSLGYFFAALQVNFRDTQYLLNIALRLGFFVTGIFFSPADMDEQYQWLFRFNPMTILITSYRTIFIEGVAPDMVPLFIVAIISSILLIFGLSFFNRASQFFAEEI
jgi:lipopolysaccharide transport system permease protein